MAPAPPPENAPAAAARALARFRRLLWCAAALVVLQWCALVEGPSWRLDLWHRAESGFPRLMGVWTPAGVIVFAVAGVPVLLALALRLLPRERRAATAPWWIGWLAAMALFGGAEVLFRFRPDLMPERALLFLPYRAWDRFPFGIQMFEEDPLLMLRHRPHRATATRVDYGRTGDLALTGGLGDAAATAPSDIFRAVRRTRERGLDADFGSISDPDEPADLALLGDSFVVGYCLPPDLTLPALLATRLAEADGDTDAAADPALARRRVAPFACGNYTPHEGLMALLLEGAPRHPATLVALYYEGNDLTDAERNGNARVHGETPGSPYRRALLRRPPSLLETSPVHALLAAAFRWTDLRVPASVRAAPWTAFRPMRPAETRELRADPVLARVPSTLRWASEWSANAAEPLAPDLGRGPAPLALSPYELLAAARPGDWPAGHPGWPHLLAGLNDLAHLRRTQGVRVVVAWAPTKVRVLLPFLSDADLDADRLAYFVGPLAGRALLEEAREAGSWRPLLARRGDVLARAVEREARRRGLEWLDLTPDLITATRATGTLPYFPWDTHWNPAGHAVAARALARHLLAPADAAPRPAAPPRNPRLPAAGEAR